MPVQIGMATHSFADPTRLLSDCHRRIEMFLGALQSVAAIVETPLPEEARQSLQTALQYFREAAPRHTEDEEASLFPRMRQLQSSEIEMALQRLDALEEDHQRAAPLHALVDRLGRQCLQAGPLPAQEAGELRSALAELKKMYAQHIEVEDTLVFPAAAKWLSPAELGAVGQEMAKRRSVSGGLLTPQASADR
ncbi:MAG: hemerythrin domain-containing protein [Acidobacteria bacterium]|nr:hemerythrin domain-containing protein [Acidobacteriota bacterium]